MNFLGRKGAQDVLQRVTSALTQLIKPVATATHGVSSTENPTQSPLQKQEFQRAQPKKVDPQKPRGENAGREEHTEKDPQSENKNQQSNVIPLRLARSTPPTSIEASLENQPQDPAGGPFVPNPGEGAQQEDANALVNLLNAFHEQRGSLMRWMGGRVYQTTVKTQKRSSKFKKGAMLDEKAE